VPELRASFPHDLKLVAFLGGCDDLDISFWRPYGSRKVEQIAFYETAEQLRQRKFKYAVVSGAGFEWQGSISNVTFQQWLVQARAEVLTNTTVTTTVTVGPQPWYFVRFQD
jgi:hypothetical protein